MYRCIGRNPLITSNFNFQYVAIYLTKIVAFFIFEQFEEISVDLVLESEIYLSLIYVLIGLEVSKKTYQIIRNKYIYVNDKEIQQRKLQQLKLIQEEKEISELMADFAKNKNKIILRKSQRMFNVSLSRVKKSNALQFQPT